MKSCFNTNVVLCPVTGERYVCFVSLDVEIVFVLNVCPTNYRRYITNNDDNKKCICMNRGFAVSKLASLFLHKHDSYRRYIQRQSAAVFSSVSLTCRSGLHLCLLVGGRCTCGSQLLFLRIPPPPHTHTPHPTPSASVSLPLLVMKPKGLMLLLLSLEVRAHGPESEREGRRRGGEEKQKKQQ